MYGIIKLVDEGFTVKIQGDNTMTTNQKTTISGVDCYGRIGYGKAVELIFTDFDDSVVVISHHTNWEDFVKDVTPQFAPISEMVVEA